MVVKADRLEQLIAESIARQAESLEYRLGVGMGAMILVWCLSTLLSFRTVMARLEATHAANAANDGNVRGGVPDAGGKGTDGHFGSKELRALRHVLHEPARSGGSVGHTRATRQGGGSAGAVLASSKGRAPCPPGRAPPADKPVDVAARSPRHHNSRESAKRPDAATSRSWKEQKESKDCFKRCMPSTRDSNGTGGLSDAVRPRSPSDPLPPLHIILKSSLTQRSSSQPVLRPEAEVMRLKELGKVSQRGDSLDGMISARTGSAVRAHSVRAHSVHDRGFPGPLIAANSRGASPRRVESASGKSPRTRGSPDEKIPLPAGNSRGASPRRGSASPQRTFSASSGCRGSASPQRTFSASSGCLFYANIVDKELRSKQAETTC